MTTPSASSYPVQYNVVPQLTGRNRKTVLFRFFLAVPHLLILGGAGISGSYWMAHGWSRYSGGGAGLGSAAEAMAVVAWFGIIFWNQHPRGLWSFASYYLHWVGYFAAYFALLRDEYPPFGEGDYPVTIDFGEMPANESRNRWSVGLRLIYVIPHALALIFLGLAAVFTTVFSWFIIVFTGNQPEGLANFTLGVVRWALRVQAYLLLMQDEYPPFSLT